MRFADADEQQGHFATARRKVGELPDQVLLGARHLGVVDRILQAQHHGDDSAAGLLDDVVGESGPGGGAVERGTEGGREDRGKRTGIEGARLPEEQIAPRRSCDMTEMTHVIPPVLPGRPDNVWPVIVRTDGCRQFPAHMNSG